MDNVNLIRKVAWSFHKSTGMDWDDLFQEAAIAYYESLKTYNESRGKITTHTWNCITNHLKNYLKEQRKYKDYIWEEELSSLMKVKHTKHPAQVTSEFWEALTNEAQVIAGMILFTPRRYIGRTAEEIEERIMRIMVCNGWSRKKVNAALKNLRAVCQ